MRPMLFHCSSSSWLLAYKNMEDEANAPQFKASCMLSHIMVADLRDRKGYSVTPYSIFNNLSKRYQVEENLWTIRTLKVYVYTNTSFMAAYLIVFSFVTFENGLFTKPVYYSLVEVSSTLYLYALALPLVLWYNGKDVQRQISSAIHRNLTIGPNRLFEELRSQWDMQLIIPKKRPFQHLTFLTSKTEKFRR
ncbi:hypothetical protein OESDEN_03252 [Oesophagostomum dentatum]|uniref:Uncharacterized protein n=1 Tax=Oesophagostomum dentatum TaxID=61180 RepID=A0A0B1TN08_OESDE|nr:hypothetical protein OESDEN_03252 [Oesophagostomum dentatum]